MLATTTLATTASLRTPTQHRHCHYDQRQQQQQQSDDRLRGQIPSLNPYALVLLA